MRYSYKTVQAWLSTHINEFSIDQLRAIDQLVQGAIAGYQSRQQQTQQALDQVNEAARAAGFASLEDLLKQASPQLALPLTRALPASHPLSASAPVPRSAPRRPFLDPCDPNTECWALMHRGDNLPDWAKQRLAEGWLLEELHWKRIRAARAARGLPPDEPWNPEQKHRELMAKVEAVPRFRRPEREPR